MKIKRHFSLLHALKRHKHHPVIHRIHRKHRISYRTLFYMKEYGSRSHATATIIKESLKIVVIAAVISSIGGIGLENAKEKIATILPLLIMIPALNDMIGDFGTIISSKFTTMIYTGRVKIGNVSQSKDLKRLVMLVVSIALISAVYMSAASYGIAYFRGFPFDAALLWRIVAVAISCTAILVSIIFGVSIVTGIFVYSRREDPNNFLIPIATAVADLASMLLFSFLVVRLF